MFETTLPFNIIFFIISDAILYSREKIFGVNSSSKSGMLFCKSVVKIIALTYSSYQYETIGSAHGSLVTKYVDHGNLCCNENADIRHRVWIGFWDKYGIDLYLRLAGLKWGIYS